MKAFDEGVSYSLTEQVFRALEKDILNGVCQPGQSLTEASLCKRMSVSRTPVREALCQLEQEGLVQIQRNRGAVVVGITERDIEEIYTIRTRIEGLAARWAAERMTPEEKAELAEIVALEEFYADKGNLDQNCELDHRFHDLCYIGSRSKQLRNMLKSMHRYICRARGASFRSGDRPAISAREHRAILEAIERGDGELADLLTRTHIANAKASMLKNMKTPAQNTTAQETK